MDKIFFDIESTGPSTTKDRIVQLAIVVVDEEDKVLLKKSKLYNPTIPITKAAMDIHGITDADVADKTTFQEDAIKLKKLFENKILITYNGLKFDIPLLMAEFERAGVKVELSGKAIDVLKVERHLHPNDLGTVYKRYTGKTLDGAHDALADIIATKIIYKYHYEHLYNSIEQADGAGADIEEKDWDIDNIMMELSGSKDSVDYSGKLARDSEGFLIFTFGKCKDKRVIDNKEYASWILSNDFPAQVKNLITGEINKHTIAKPTKKLTQSTKQTLFGEPNDDLPF